MSANIVSTAKKIILIFFAYSALFYFRGKIESWILWASLVILALWSIFEIERFFNHLKNIKYQELEINDSEIIIRNLKTKKEITVNSSQFDIGKVIKKDGIVISIGIKYKYAPTELAFKNYENMNDILGCLKRCIKSTR